MALLMKGKNMAAVQICDVCKKVIPVNVRGNKLNITIGLPTLLDSKYNYDVCGFDCGMDVLNRYEAYVSAMKAEKERRANEPWWKVWL
jgi:hypothetical protein